MADEIDEIGHTTEWGRPVGVVPDERRAAPTKRREADMDIGRTIRTYTIEPITSPVPAQVPVEPAPPQPLEAPAAPEPVPA
jgi:hypothetical protein